MLAGFGVYGVVAYATHNRTREVGIRVSLGARPPDVMRSVMRGGLLPAIGLVAIAIVACVVPGRRALRVDPVMALRQR